jgi:hypothetical protein
MKRVSISQRLSPDPKVATHHRSSIIKCYLDNSDNLQCGQERPSCQRCSDAGVICTGYRNEFDPMHRSEGEKQTSCFETKYSRSWVE